jgi:hypothetical protein
MKSTAMDLVLGKLEKVSRSGTEWKACCPAHEDSSPSLTIRQKDGVIVLKCHAGCKQLDVLHALELEWKDLFIGDDYALWNMVYKRLIQCAKLSPSDLELLVARGLTNDWISLGGFRSLSDPGTRRSVIQLFEEFGEDLYSVPGFCTTPNGARIKAQSGILLPVMNEKQEVCGFQIMTNSTPKYIWFTGDTSAKSFAHVPWQALERDTRTSVRVTEGVLKCEIACCVDDTTLTIGVPGVNNWSTALPVLRGLGAQEVRIAFDVENNPNTKAALTDFYYALKNEGFQTLIEVWNPEYKGIDDALLAGCEITTIEKIPSDTSIKGVRPASDYKTLPVEWVWHGWLPKGMLVVLEGDPSLGKSTLCADIAMRITTCTPFPGTSTKPTCGSVLFLSAEDDPGRITVPRMRAAGADLSKVYFWEVHPTFPQKIGELEQIIESLGIVLVVMDPLLAFLGDDVDSYKDQNIRQVLSPLSKMAERTGACVLMIRHLTKQSVGVSQMYRGSGSIAIVAASRVCLYMIQDDDSDDRVLGQVKNNLAPKQPSWAFGFTECGTSWQDTKLTWKGRSEK